MNLPLDIVEAIEKKTIAPPLLTIDESKKKLEKLKARREKKKKAAEAQVEVVETAEVT